MEGKRTWGVKSYSGLIWCNDDDDGSGGGAENVGGTADSDDDGIKSYRDLEDFARLHIHIGGLQDPIATGALQVGLEWRETNGTNPSIKVYQAAEIDGGDQYLKTDLGAGNQALGSFATTLGTISVGGSFKFPVSFWQWNTNGLLNLSEDDPNRYLLFEGVTPGKGHLVLTIWKGNQKIGEGPGVWLDIKNIKEMYERVDSATAHPWDNSVRFDPDPQEDKQNAIVFVHGWRMSPEGAGNFAETMYKRLWHRGYKGRFAAFHWDTHWHDGWQWLNDMGVNIGAVLANYNDSEYTAWHSASALKNFVNGLSFPNKNIVAHSMGNIVAGEALRQGMQIKNYALMQAAVPAACYDESDDIQQATPYYHLTLKMWDNLTPDDDSDPETRALAYRGRFANVGGNLINFFLPDDEATSFAWEVNNDQAKPDGPLADYYRYKRNNPSGEKLYRYHVEYIPTDPPTPYDVPDYYLSDPKHNYEAMAFACRTWGKAVGAFGPTPTMVGTHGAIDDSIDLSDPAYQLPGVQGSGFHDQHSGQFNANIQHLKPFYDILINRLDVGTPNP